MPDTKDLLEQVKELPADRLEVLASTLVSARFAFAPVALLLSRGLP